MKKLLIALPAAAMLATPAMAMQGFSTCHAASTTVTSISGFDTASAKMVAAYTRPDALEYCHRDPGAARDDAEEGGATEQHLAGDAACADKTMQNLRGLTVITWANCKKATLTVQYSPVPESVYYSGKGSIHVTHYKFPVIASCGGDNMAAIAAFRTLCPSYEGNLESGE